MIQADVITVSGYSAHADQNDLLNFIQRMRHRPRQVRVVHGDRDAKVECKARLEELAAGCRFFMDMVVPRE